MNPLTVPAATPNFPPCSSAKPRPGINPPTNRISPSVSSPPNAPANRSARSPSSIWAASSTWHRKTGETPCRLPHHGRAMSRRARAGAPGRSPRPVRFPGQIRRARPGLRRGRYRLVTTHPAPFRRRGSRRSRRDGLAGHRSDPRGPRFQWHSTGHRGRQSDRAYGRAWQ